MSPNVKRVQAAAFAGQEHGSNPDFFPAEQPVAKRPRTTAPALAAGLHSLPNELLDQVAGYLDNTLALCELAATDGRLRAIGQRRPAYAATHRTAQSAQSVWQRTAHTRRGLDLRQAGPHLAGLSPTQQHAVTDRLAQTAPARQAEAIRHIAPGFAALPQTGRDEIAALALAPAPSQARSLAALGPLLKLVSPPLVADLARQAAGLAREDDLLTAAEGMAQGGDAISPHAATLFQAVRQVDFDAGLEGVDEDRNDPTPHEKLLRGMDRWAVLLGGQADDAVALVCAIQHPHGRSLGLMALARILPQLPPACLPALIGGLQGLSGTPFARAVMPLLRQLAALPPALRGRLIALIPHLAIERTRADAVDAASQAMRHLDAVQQRGLLEAVFTQPACGQRALRAVLAAAPDLHEAVQLAAIRHAADPVHGLGIGGLVQRLAPLLPHLARASAEYACALGLADPSSRATLLRHFTGWDGPTRQILVSAAQTLPDPAPRAAALAELAALRAKSGMPS